MSGVDLFGDVSTEEGRMKKRPMRASEPSDGAERQDPREVHTEKAPRVWNEYGVLRCKKCGAFVGNGGWIPFGTCKQCGEAW